MSQGAAIAAASNTTEVLVFGLGAVEYGVPIHLVQELRRYESPTAVADAPRHVKGFINLRGEIVPIIDLRIRLNLGVPTYDQFTTVIILELASRKIGAVVDRVCDVVALTPQDVRPAPEIGGAGDSLALEGVGVIDGRMLLLADMQTLISFDSGILA